VFHKPAVPPFDGYFLPGGCSLLIIAQLSFNGKNSRKDCDEENGIKKDRVGMV
jgi:hypothetical protein